MLRLYLFVLHRLSKKCIKIYNTCEGNRHDPVTWYGINYTGKQITQWDFQNKGLSGWTGKRSYVFEVPLRYFRPSIIYSVPCDRILQRAYCTTRLTLPL